MILLILVATSMAGDTLPEGWILSGSSAGNYRARTVQQPVHDGQQAVLLESRTARATGFATVMQSFLPRDYQGQRVRLTGWLKCENVTHWAGMWMRIDTAQLRAVSFDNMQTRPLKGTEPWTSWSVVLDVPDNASNLAFGAMLSGPGRLWIDDYSLEIVDHTVKVTNLESAAPEGPKSLNFD